MIKAMTDQPTSARSRRSSVATRPAPRRPSNAIPRVSGKAQEAVDKLLDKVRAKADQGPTAASKETEREEKRDAKGLFQEGTKPGPGRPSGSLNKIPRSIKEVMRALSEGAIEVGFRDPLTGEATTGPLAHLIAEKLAEGLQLPAKDAHVYVETMLEYGMGRPKTQAESGADDRKQIPRMIFLSPPHDPMAKPGDPPKPLRILGQTAGPNGEIIDAKTLKVVVPAPARRGSGPVDDGPVDDGLGEGSSRASRGPAETSPEWSWPRSRRWWASGWS
jgi:hypothetical protein